MADIEMEDDLNCTDPEFQFQTPQIKKETESNEDSITQSREPSEDELIEQHYEMIRSSKRIEEFVDEILEQN